uniref:Uncharacterized protein n=1 Tax=Ascaris lumbricoides TaxID=6252 RepID=A0A0M3IHL3_ASCLU
MARLNCQIHNIKYLLIEILLLKNRARIILWTVISRSKNDGVKIDDVEKLYNEIQREWGRETVEFDADLKEQIRREALLHDGCFFKLFKDDNCNSRLKFPRYVFHNAFQNCEFQQNQLFLISRARI